MANLVHRYLGIKMFQKKSTHIKNYQEKTILDNILWFIENYLPQKNKKSSHKEFLLENFESDAINKIKNLAFTRSKSLGRDLNNTKITFTVGNWVLPYLNLLKKLKLLK
tara:strand:- start:625 stop:951 length:327 start_codon:yes stop_codon:yes gene_type:complete